MTNNTPAKNRFWTFAIVAALVVGLGAGWRGASARGDTIIPEASSTDSAPSAVALDVDQQQAAFALQSQIIDVYESASPAVVNITSSTTVASAFGGAMPQEGTGSGFVYDGQGHIVTNYHVVEDADKVTVTFGDSTVYEATIVGTDPINDLAVLGIDAGDSLPAPLELTDSDALRIGQFVLAIGNPFRLDQTLTLGVVSALGRVIDSPEGNRFIGEAIQTDAAINPGNSGGPMLDLNGRVIGVNSQIISPSGANAGIGFAVSANSVARVVPELIASGRYRHPWLGVQLFTLSPSSADALRDAGINLTVDAGLLIMNVVQDSPADQAGLSDGSRTAQVNGTDVPVDSDILVAINGEPARSFEELTVYLETSTRVGETAQVTVLRDGRELILPVTLGELPTQ
jgi:S1-C subfamily serine protease